MICACGDKPSAIAELTQAEGPVERQQASAVWTAAQVGAQYFLGDAARTGEATATLDVGGGAARIIMQHRTVLRFGGKPGASKISVELGAIDLANTGRYTLDVGDVKLAKNAAVRITAQGPGRSTVELILGGGEVAANGSTVELVLGQPVDVGSGAAPPIDAGVDARIAVDAAPDAAAPVAGDATIEVVGKKAEVRAPGATAWKPLPPGTGSLVKGSAIRLGLNTTAKVVAATTTLELGGSTRVVLGDDLAFAVELGGVHAVATAPASVALPGGAVALSGTPAGAAETRLDANPRETKITMLRGGSKLTGASGAELGMSRGESAILTRAGAIRVIEAIPGYFDFRVGVGESLTIHDPRPPTAVQFQFDGKCPDGGGIIEIDRDGRFRTSKVSAGKDFANVLIPGGTWSYRLRCTSNGGEGNAIASGRVSAVRDDGRRPLPKNQGVNDIDADGRNYRISYQSAIPSVAVHVRNPGASHKLHLASGGKEQTFDSSTATITVPGAQLHEGTYSYWIDRDGAKQDKVSSLTIDFDQTAPQVYIESPGNGQPWSGDIDVRGAVLPGWAATVEAIAIPVDKQRRFAAKVGAPSGTALAIRLSHPQRGVHYYLRRQK